jgi:uncharacterized protein YwbE|tara:strand:- start:398 stop:646 length:249 start_codon:yes stop_codon:yes gene_type:complete
MKITMMEQLDSLSVTQLKNTKDIIDVMIKNKVKNEMKVGMKVNVVQKTKKTPGVITKIMNARCLVDLSGKVYRVPMSMLEAA